MRYQEGKLESAEIFRLVIQKMRDLGSSFTPVHYTVVYEYVTGINPPLTEVMDEILASGATVSDEAMEGMFMDYVIPEMVLPLIDHRDSLTKDIQNLLQKLADSTSKTSHETQRFQEGLEGYSKTLRSDKMTGAATLGEVINGVLRDTVSMRNASLLLEGKLGESRQEIHKLQKELQTARVDALVDPLTQLLNRRGLELEMQRVAGAKPGYTVSSFLMLDIDHFKGINDTHGHLVGDMVIQTVAAVLRAGSGKEDVAARVGGEEFAVVLPGVPIQKAHMLAENIRRKVEKIEIAGSKSARKFGGITISIGIDTFSDGGSWQKAMEKADAALYKSKKDGRNRTTIYFSE